MTVYESDLPGVGKKFEVDLESGERLVIVTHNTGKREVYIRAGDDADSEKVFEASDRLARKIGTILEGAYFQPVQTDKVETLLADDTFIEWFNVDAGGEIAGQSIAEARVRERTGVSIVAIQRDGDLVSAPDPETVLEVGDTVVVIGERDDCAEFEELISNGREA